MFSAAIGYFLFQHERSGKGQYLDISLLDTYFHHEVKVKVKVQGYSASKDKSLSRRLGIHHNGGPSGYV